MLVDALEAGNDGDLLLAQALPQLGVVDAADARVGERRVGEDADLVPEEAARLRLHLLDGERQKPHRDLLAGGNHHVLLALARAPGDLARHLEQAIGLASHGGDHHHHVMPLLAGRDRPARDIADALGVPD